MPIASINGKDIEFEQGMSVIQVADKAGVEVPRFCYHDKLQIAGNCRMCLVEIEGGPPKPAASCAMPCGDGMKIHTDTPMVKKAREGVMEFLLINHPLDCPICDQGGECDLQDQAVAYGKSGSRYEEEKRAVKDKELGPLVKTVMTRCIQCTRCIRFMDDIAGTSQLGATGRGEDMEVGTFIAQNITSELSGNIVDLCPVGALTSKPYAFKARSWELKRTEGIDVMDAVGSSIRIDSKGNEVMRVVPRSNDEINEDWITDKARYCYDGLLNQRLDKPFIKIDGKFKDCTWDMAIERASAKIKNSKTLALVGGLADAESITALKDLAEGINAEYDCRLNDENYSTTNRAGYIFNSTIEGTEEADKILIIGTNPRYDAALVNARIRKTVVQNGTKVGIIGDGGIFNYPTENLGNEVKFDFLKGAKKPLVILGESLASRQDWDAILEDANKAGEVNVLVKDASKVGALDLGFVSNEKTTTSQKLENAETIILLGADEIEAAKLEGKFVIYIGSHGDAGANEADVILPAAAFTEKHGTYVNLEGRVQRSQMCVFPVGDAMADYKIINKLAETLNVEERYSTITEIRERMVEINPIFDTLDEIVEAKWVTKKTAKTIGHDAVTIDEKDFYQTNPVLRASNIMADCSKELWANRA